MHMICNELVLHTVTNETAANSSFNIAEVVAVVDEILGPIVTSMCPADCNHRGICNQTVCTCDEGTDCYMHVNLYHYQKPK